MLKGKITQEEFNELYVEYRKNYQHWNKMNVSFEMVCKLHGMKSVEFEDRMNYLDNNPPPEIEEMFMTPTVDLEERIKLENDLDDEGGFPERMDIIGQNGNDGVHYEDDDIYEDFIDERPPKDEDWGDEEDSNEY